MQTHYSIAIKQWSKVRWSNITECSSHTQTNYWIELGYYQTNRSEDDIPTLLSNTRTTALSSGLKRTITVFIVPVKRIVSPSSGDLTPHSFCKIKGLEKHLCKVVALGTEADMKTKMEELNGGVDTEVDPPPRRKCVRKENTQKRRKGKENQTALSARKNADK